MNYMNTIPQNNGLKSYDKPGQKVIATSFEQVFLPSNLEPIDGGDYPDIDW